jgi:hypothetical protein
MTTHTITHPREALESWLNREANENWAGVIGCFIWVGLVLSAPAWLGYLVSLIHH